MTNEQSLTKWLEENTALSWTRSGGDEPPVKLDRLYINRSEGYEVRDFILKYYKHCNLKHSPSNYEKSLNKIMAYKKGEKIKTQDLLDCLEGLLSNSK
ncbi:hypothetical protein [Methylomicrobium lacus]|uniref:hypothetical protein n=1 Tax=Methylomicrobium lacus TaxID=136992 RepID=UPI0035A92C90